MWFCDLIWYDNNSYKVNFYLPVLRNAKTFVVACLFSYILITSLKWDWPLLTHHWAYIFEHNECAFEWESERASERAHKWVRLSGCMIKMSHCLWWSTTLQWDKNNATLFGLAQSRTILFLIVFECVYVYVSKYVRTRHFELTAIIILDFTLQVHYWLPAAKQ